MKKRPCVAWKITGMQLVLALPMVVVTGGCYSYSATAMDLVPVGSEVKALISTERQVALWEILGEDKRTVTGRVLENHGDRLLLAVTTSGSGSRALYQRIALPRRDVLRLDVRREEPGRTVALVGILGGGALLATLVALKGGIRGGTQPTPAEPTERILGWIFRLPLRIR